MQYSDDPTLFTRWFPVAATREVIRRHVFQTQLLDEELALWRADDGAVNLWENRCPHRGLRLTLGHNLGRELRCQYHGWRYESDSGRCTAIAAHPGLTPPKGVRVKFYAVCEKYGFVWGNLADGGAKPNLPALNGASSLTLRSLPFQIGATRLRESLDGCALPGLPRFGIATRPAAVLRALDDFVLRAGTATDAAEERLLFLLQPLDGGRTVLHGALAAPYRAEARLQILRHYSDILSDLRRRIEAEEPIPPAKALRQRGPGPLGRPSVVRSRRLRV